MKRKITIVCDPLFSEYGPTRPPVLIARELRKLGYDVELIAIVANEKVRNRLESQGLEVRLLGGRTPFKSESLAWFYFWMLEGFLSANSDKLKKRGLSLEGTVLNFSNTIVSPCKIWYAQGPPTVLLDNIKEHLALHYRAVYSLSSQILRRVDKKMILRFSSVSEKVVANSRYLATIYEKWGTRVDAVIYPPIDCQSFKPVAKSPRGDYAVTYFGKETNFRVIQNALDNGIKIKAFGGKIATAPKKTLSHPNLEFLGRVSDSQLVELYSNASFTFFPFIDEPFGYIPVESMACGTPVVTFGKQGPGETVVNEVTGWLAENEDELVKIASKIWKEGYPRGIRDNCRRKSLMFDVGSIAQQWLDKIDT